MQQRTRYFHSQEDEEQPTSHSTRIVISSEAPIRKHNGRPTKSSKICPYCLEPLHQHDCKEIRCQDCFHAGHIRGDCLGVFIDGKRLACQFCRKPGHARETCPSAAYAASLRIHDPDRLICLVCGKVGHLNCAPFPGPRKVSCFYCAELGHEGPDCPLNPERNKSRFSGLLDAAAAVLKDFGNRRSASAKRGYGDPLKLANRMNKKRRR